MQIETTKNPDTPLAAALDRLLQTLDGISNTRQALNDFLAHRSDWWAYTENQPEPAVFAAQRLQKALHLTEREDPIAAFLTLPGLMAELQHYSGLLSRHPIQAHLTVIEQLTIAGRAETPLPEKYRRIHAAFMTKNGEARKLNKTILSQLDAQTGEKLLALHEKITTALYAVREIQRKWLTFNVSTAWYTCGERLLQHYQRLKSEKNLLDFTDLEWRAYRLLTRSHHA